MPTTTPLTDAIQALTTYANEVTGANDTTLSEAVATLAAGYGQGGGESSDVLTWKACGQTGASFRGVYTNINEIVIDMDNRAQSMPSMSYMALKTADGKITFKNISSSATGSQMNMSDFMRQSPCVSEIDFGGLSPASTVRWFNQFGYSQNGLFHSGTVTCKNLGLNNLASNNDSFAGGSSALYGTFDVYFVGELKTTINLSGWRLLNADSINRLVSCLYDYSGGDAHTLTLGSNLLPLVDSAHQAIAAARNWTLA